jgi:hypothetical protein
MMEVHVFWAVQINIYVHVALTKEKAQLPLYCKKVADQNLLVLPDHDKLGTNVWEGVDHNRYR